jgi:phosphoglycerate dehydrogenase-like enzyme
MLSPEYIDAITRIANHKALQNPYVINEPHLEQWQVERVLMAVTLFTEEYMKYMEGEQ